MHTTSLSGTITTAIPREIFHWGAVAGVCVYVRVWLRFNWFGCLLLGLSLEASAGWGRIEVKTTCAHTLPSGKPNFEKTASVCPVVISSHLIISVKPVTHPLPASFWRWRDPSRAAPRVTDLCSPRSVWGWRCSAGASLFSYYLSVCSSVLSVTLLWLWTAASLTAVSIATVCSVFIVSANKNVLISSAEVIRKYRSQPPAGTEGSGMFVRCWLAAGRIFF